MSVPFQSSGHDKISHLLQSKITSVTMRVVCGLQYQHSVNYFVHLSTSSYYMHTHTHTLSHTHTHDMPHTHTRTHRYTHTHYEYDRHEKYTHTENDMPVVRDSHEYDTLTVVIQTAMMQWFSLPALLLLLPLLLPCLDLDQLMKMHKTYSWKWARKEHSMFQGQREICA